MYKCPNCVYECRGQFLMIYHLSEKHGFTWNYAKEIARDLVKRSIGK